jgi:CRISPR-associated protein Csm3
VVQLFGVSGDAQLSEERARAIGPTRLSFWDCELSPAWLKEVESMNLGLTEVKSENSINRITGVAVAPRFFERVPAGAAFDFRLSLKVLDGEDLLPTVLAGLRLIELDSLGGSGSRGYGKVRFVDLKVDGEATSLPTDPFAA